MVRPRNTAETIKQRILDECERDDNECWIWHGAVDSKGYAVIKAGGRQYALARKSWEIFVGSPLRPQDHVVRECLVRCCVNPAHLVVKYGKDKS